MQSLKLKSNIKCNGCIAKVGPELDALEGVKNWSVDLEDPSRIVSLEIEDIDVQTIKERVAKVGYQLEEL